MCKGAKRVWVFVLALCMLMTVASIGIGSRVFETVTSHAQEKRDYTQLTYQELDTISYRTSVSYTSPQITVLTHGLGGGSYHWSNNGGEELTYDEDSLIEQLREELSGEMVVYIAHTEISGYTVNTKEGKMSKQVSDENALLTEEAQNQDGAASLRMEYGNFTFGGRGITLEQQRINESGTAYISNEVARTSLAKEDVNKHILIVFDAVAPEEDYTDESHDYVYARFEYLLDALSYQYLQLTGELPTYNLIGHSRGGITNLQYALAHPYNVASLYSMGTPYNGSAFSRAGSFFLELADCDSKIDYVAFNEKGEATTESDYYPGVLDVMNLSLTDSYKKYWNEHHTEYYAHIQFKPIGTYVTFGFAVRVLEEYLIKNQKALNVSNAVLTPFEYFIDYVSDFPIWMRRKLTPIMIDWAKDLMKAVDGVSTQPWEQIFNNLRYDNVRYTHLGRSNYECYLYADDLFIDLDSQVAYGYVGENVYVRLMSAREQKRGRAKKSMPDSEGVAHNLEARDSVIINYIVNDINLGKGEARPYDMKHTKDGYEITNLQFNDNEDKSTLRIPEEYKGQSVVGVGLTRDVVIGGDERYHTDITKVIIPKTVKYISDYAFYGMSNLQTVEFEDGSALETIGIGAFMNCSALTDFHIGSNISFLGAGAFNGCASLSAFTIDSENTYFSVQDGVVLTADETILCAYPQGKTDTAYTMPASVVEIGESAFAENSTLKTLDLGNVRMIRKCGLWNCSALSSITAGALQYTEVGALEGSAYLEKQTGNSVTLGKVLLKQQGDATAVDLRGLTSVAPYAFADNKSVQTVTIDNVMRNFGEGAFYGCENLNSVSIKNNGELVYTNVGVFGGTNATIYVPQTIREAYAENALWQPYNDAIEVLSTRVYFDSNGGSAVPDGTVYYASPVGSLPTPTRAQYRFLGWKYGDETVETASYWLQTDSEVTFVADWKPIEYNIALHTNGGAIEEDFEGLYTSQAGKALPTPVRTGYIFQGWCENADLTDAPIFSIPAGVTGDKTYYAKWEAKGYYLTLTYGYEGSPEDIHVSYKVYYDSEFTLPLPQTREGYIFNGWKYGKTLYTNEQGISTKRWDIDEDATLEADETKKTFEIQIIKKEEDGTDTIIVWLTKDGYSNNHIKIPYGTQFSSPEELEKAFNVDKVSLKPGHKFKYFTIDGETRFTIWSKIPDLGENGSIFQIEVCFEKEQRFSLAYIGETLDGVHNPLITEYDAPIELLQKSKTGYNFDGWYIADTPNNRMYFPADAITTDLRIGEKFAYVRMPDLSYDKEADGIMIHLEPRFSPKRVTVSYVTYSDETIAPTENVAYDSLPLLRMPREKRGYEFIGWCFGVNGTGEPCTNECGQTLSTWQREVDTTLYAKWKPIEYTITYELNGGSWGTVPISARPTKYTIESASFSLPTPTFSGHRFVGWYANREFLGIRIYSVAKGSTENLSFYAKWNTLYEIQFRDSSLNTVHTSIYGVSGETVTLPTLTKAHYTGVWISNSGSRYAFGSTYTINTHARFTVHWTPIEYYINYVMFDYIFSAPTSQRKYTVEYTPTFWTPTPSDANHFSFDGWYSDGEFKYPVDSASFKNISGYANYTVTLYGRWKYTRTNKYTITDSGTLKQSYDSMTFTQLTGMSLADLKLRGYKTIVFTGEITVWQSYDGYKHMRIYDGKNATEATSSWWIDHGAGKTAVKYQLNNDGKWAIDLTSITDDTIFFRYSASGKFADTWHNENLWIAVASLSTEPLPKE